MDTLNSRLEKKFFQASTVHVAKKLLGCRLVREINGVRVSGRIVETEAYLGAEDKACHGFNYRCTPRNQSLYLEGGHAYVYFIYGMYHCFNVVTRTIGVPEAVLIRALEPEEGQDIMQARRENKTIRHWTSGPGKLCRALGIDRQLDGHELTQSPLYLERTDWRIRSSDIIALPRVGIDYAEEAVPWPLRFYLRGNEHVSTPR